MSRNKSDLEVITIRLSGGARDKLQRYYPTAGYNKAIRELVDRHLAKLDEATNRTQRDKLVLPIPD